MPLEPAPDDIDEVLAAARNLAEMLEASDRAIALREARRAVETDAEASAAFAEFEAAGRVVSAAVASGNEPTFDERDALDEAKNVARRNPLLWELLRRQADYVELVKQIESVLFRAAPRPSLGVVGHRSAAGGSAATEGGAAESEAGA